MLQKAWYNHYIIKKRKKLWKKTSTKQYYFNIHYFNYFNYFNIQYYCKVIKYKTHKILALYSKFQSVIVQLILGMFCYKLDLKNIKIKLTKFNKRLLNKRY